MQSYVQNSSPLPVIRIDCTFQGLFCKLGDKPVLLDDMKEYLRLLGEKLYDGVSAGNRSNTST